MTPFSIVLVESPPFRLSIQIITFLLAAIVVQMVWTEYRRNRSEFLKYISLSFLTLFLQAIFLLITYGWSVATGQGFPETFMPLIDHLFKVTGTLFFVQAFITAIPDLRPVGRYFFKGNILLLVASAPVIRHFWLDYLATAPPAGRKFGFFWGDVTCELWIILLLVFGGYAAIRSQVKMKRAFLCAFVLLLGSESLHLWNILHTRNTISTIIVVERFLLIPYFFIIIGAIHREVVAEIDGLHHSRERLRSKLYESAIQALVGSLELKDSYTQGHAERVTQYAQEIGRCLGLDPDELRTLYLGAILHDIGKIGIHEDLLRKPEGLASAEILEFRKHPESGAGIIDRIDALRYLQATVRHHHERWDGTGYPLGLRGEEIPLHARIVAVADAFDAMTSERPYRKQPLFCAAAIAELERCRGTQFDPRVLDAFLRYIHADEVKVEEATLAHLQVDPAGAAAG